MEWSFVICNVFLFCSFQEAGDFTPEPDALRVVRRKNARMATRACDRTRARYASCLSEADE